MYNDSAVYTSDPRLHTYSQKKHFKSLHPSPFSYCLTRNQAPQNPPAQDLLLGLPRHQILLSLGSCLQLMHLALTLQWGVLKYNSSGQLQQVCSGEAAVCRNEEILHGLSCGPFHEEAHTTLLYPELVADLFQITLAISVRTPQNVMIDLMPATHIQHTSNHHTLPACSERKTTPATRAGSRNASHPRETVRSTQSLLLCLCMCFKVCMCVSQSH